jgi:hypothetical protein
VSWHKPKTWTINGEQVEICGPMHEFVGKIAMGIRVLGLSDKQLLVFSSTLMSREFVGRLDLVDADRLADMVNQGRSLVVAHCKRI